MSDFWNPPKRTEEEWYKLPPLVAKGEDRAKKLAEIVEKWCTPSPAGANKSPVVHVEAGGFVLANVDFVDANENPPGWIDLGKLLRAVEERLRECGEPQAYQPRTDLFIMLSGCRIRKCDAHGVNIRPRWTAIGTRFDEWSSFQNTTFGMMTNFEHSIFGTRCTFNGAQFTHRCIFDHAIFDQECSFDYAVFHSAATFEGSKFGAGMSFFVAAFKADANFGGASFGSVPSFLMATVQGTLIVAHASFGDVANFSGVRVVGSAVFSGATFGARAQFDRACFSSEARFNDVRFGPGGGIGGITVASAHPHFPDNAGTATAFLERTRRKLAVGVTWNLVRTAGESAILNRASMLALIMVPLVAGAWPAVHSLMLGYAFGVKGGVAMYDAARTSFLLEASRIPGAETVPEIVGKLDAQVSTIADQLQRAAAQENPLPVGWGLLFFGALAVVLGKTIYGWGAPESVRNRSRDEAREADSAEFREKADQKRDLLLRAITRLQTAAKEFPEVRHPSFVKRHAGAVWVPKSMEEFDEYKAIWDKDQQAIKDAQLRFESGADPTKAWKPERPPLAEAPDALAIILIEEGAKAQYDLDARENAFRMNLTTFLYATGLYCIAWLLVHQATAILKQSGALRWTLPDYWSVGLWVLILGWWAVSLVVALPWMMGKMKRLFA